MPPLVPAPHPEAAVYALSMLSATGTGILLAAVISGLLIGYCSGRYGARVLADAETGPVLFTNNRLYAGVGYVTRYSGTDAALGLAFAQTGVLYPMFGTLLGWLGEPWFGHRFKCPVRRSAENHCATTGA